jgi:uroporphyrinogen-III decarboxylase
VNAGINATRQALTAMILNGFFERLISFMDFEPAAIALIDEEQESAVHALFSRLCDLYEELIERYLACFRLDGIVFHDDWGSQRAPFFSPATCRKMLMPSIRRLAGFCHARGLIFQLHSCGKNEPLVPLMIEAGVDIWAPQTMNDMDFLFSAYGDKIVFALTPEDVPQDASESEVEAAARAVVQKYAPFFPQRPVLIASNHIRARLADKIYELSREALCGRETEG